MKLSNERLTILVKENPWKLLREGTGFLQVIVEKAERSEIPDIDKKK